VTPKAKRIFTTIVFRGFSLFLQQIKSFLLLVHLTPVHCISFSNKVNKFRGKHQLAE